MKLLPNTLAGLTFGLQNFDGIETDVRLCKDKELLIFHDPITKEGELIKEFEIEHFLQKGIPSFKQLLEDINVRVELQKNKTIWLELKPNCINRNRSYEEIIDEFYNKTMRSIDETLSVGFDIRVISFVPELLQPFADNSSLKCYPIIPSVNECETSKFKMYASNLPSVVLKSLKKHMYNAQESNFSGVLFARQYLLGFFSNFHPSYSKLVDLMQETGLEMGTNLGSIDLEPKYPKLHRFTDKTQNYPRNAKENEGQIIGHRGTGTKGVDIISE
jgi:glycerophosphoryl diester phosphodiesterase